jgi:hypothetical protein
MQLPLLPDGYGQRIASGVPRPAIVLTASWPRPPIVPLPTKITSQFPIELCDQILLHSTKDVLISCSLVCRRWLSIARHYLFRSVVLRYGFLRFVQETPGCKDNIARHIRSVIIGGRWMNSDGECGDMALLFRDLERIEEVQVEAWSLDVSAFEPLYSMFASQSDNVRTLSLKYVRFPSLAHMFRFIGSFNRLVRLTIDNVTWDSPATGSAHPDSHSLYNRSAEERSVDVASMNLKTISLSSCHVAPILTWLLHGNVDSGNEPCPRRLISSFTAPEFLPGDTSVIASFLRVAGSSLKHVDLGMLPHTSNSFDRRLLEGVFYFTENIY